MGFENLPTQGTNENKAEQEIVKGTNENEAEQEAVISLEILKSTSDFQEVFNANNKKLWLMGSLSIAAHLGRPHRNIENDIDFFTTSDNMDEVILDLEDKGFVVEEFSGNKFRATNPDTGIRADVAILDINSDTGNYEVAEWSFPASGFEGEEKEIEGLSVRPISLEMITVMKKVAAEKSGGKHVLDYQVLSEELERQGLDTTNFENNMRFDGLDIIDKSDLTGDDWEQLIELKWAKYGELKERFVEFHERASDESYEYPKFLLEIFSVNILDRIRKKAAEMDIEQFRSYIAAKFSTYFKERFEDDAYKDVK